MRKVKLCLFSSPESLSARSPGCHMSPYSDSFLPAFSPLPCVPSLHKNYNLSLSDTSHAPLSVFQLVDLRGRELGETRKAAVTLNVGQLLFIESPKTA